MAVNKQPITTITKDDIGRPVSYQCRGMRSPRHGTIAGLSRFKGYAFVKYPGRNRHIQEDTYNMRWGHVTSWLRGKNDVED